jgi:hypothetical protein
MSEKYLTRNLPHFANKATLARTVVNSGRPVGQLHLILFGLHANRIRACGAVGWSSTCVDEASSA